MSNENNSPSRRNRLDEMVPAESRIVSAMQAIEEMPPNVRLTEAIILLEQAKNKVSDYVDAVKEQQGLIKKYYIQKIKDGELHPVDEGFDAFVLRLDDGGDPKHVEACKVAVLAYADAIKEYLPELSKDLIAKYS